MYHIKECTVESHCTDAIFSFLHFIRKKYNIPLSLKTVLFSCLIPDGKSMLILLPTLTHNLIRTATSIGNAFITMDVLLSEGNIWPPVKMEGFSFYIPRSTNRWSKPNHSYSNKLLPDSDIDFFVIWHGAQFSEPTDLLDQQEVN